MSQLEICLFVFCWVNLPLFPQIKLYQFIFQLGGFHVIVASRIIIFIAFKNLRIIKSKSPFCFWFIFLFPKHYMPIFPFSWENDPWIVHFIIQKKKFPFAPIIVKFQNPFIGFEGQKNIIKNKIQVLFSLR